MYVLEHIVSLYYRTAKWMFTKLGRDEVLMVPYKCCCFLPDPSRGGSRAEKNRSQGVPIFNELLLQTGRLHLQTECIAMI